LGGDIPRPGDGTTLPRGTTGKVVEIEDGDLVVQFEFDGLPDPIGIIELRESKRLLTGDRTGTGEPLIPAITLPTTS
jgi:hypothetical protein